jgi:beta-glucanase (GH16 family)
VPPAFTFDDECNGSSINPAWSSLFGPGDPGFAIDTDFMADLRQVSVANGLCTITAERKTTPSGRPFASACLATFGTFAQSYGTWEARFRYPAGQGMWPAFFLLPEGSKNPYPEIDVLEAYPAPAGSGGGSGANVIVSTLHYGLGLNHYFAVDMGVDMTSAFHTYKLVWSPGRIVFYVDGSAIGTVTSDVPSGRMYPIFDLALGTGGYRVDGTTPSPARMDIDYLRVSTP